MSSLAGMHDSYDHHFRTILGLEFFNGTGEEAVARMKDGGLLVVPAAPALKDLSWNRSYRDALLGADLRITDSSYMVMVWNLLQRDNVYRLSGLEYLSLLLDQPDVQRPGRTFWIMANESSSNTNLRYLAASGVSVPLGNSYIAPFYSESIDDPALLQRLTELRPQHIIVTLGGGVQEKLGLYLKRNLNYAPSIHCIGAAIAFLSGDQVRIPMWSDRFYLGWLCRCLSDPKRYVPRYWAAQKLLLLLLRYRSELPIIEG